ncbi:MAG: hypothetical protein F6K28_24725 [Microcoleus sp. SIO2G3]|nr:hypothetical protein [Microcoleus sp. SIO2G3]
MSLTTRAKTVLSGAIACMALLTLTASPMLADTHDETVTPTTTASSTNEAKLAHEQTNQTPQQPNQMGCSCCKNMMNNMPGMMGGQSNQSR